MFWNILFGVVTAVFAVFGLVCAVRMLAEWLFPPEQIAVAVEIRKQEDADLLEMLLHEARSASFQKGGARLVVLLAKDLAGDGDLPVALGEVLDRYHAECYLVEW